MDWFNTLSKDEKKLLTYAQKKALKRFDEKIKRDNRNWNRLTVPVGINVIDKKKITYPFTVDFLLSQKYRFLKPIERQVVKLLVQKYKLTEIADMLGLSYCRVRGLIAKIRDKCKVVQHLN